jgi:hypothetical protein
MKAPVFANVFGCIDWRRLLVVVHVRSVIFLRSTGIGGRSSERRPGNPLPAGIV